MRLIIARCSVTYSGRLSTTLAEAVRLILIKADGTVQIHSDGGSSKAKPLNWMTPPTAIAEEAGADSAPARIIVRKQRAEERLEIEVSEVLCDLAHVLDTEADLEKDGVERDLQDLLAERPDSCGEGFRLVRREWPTDIGPVDLMCRAGDDEWVAVEIKRVATIEAVEQLTRYLERIRRDPALGSCRGVLAAQTFRPQARVLAQAREIACAEVDLALLRGEREPALTLFGA